MSGEDVIFEARDLTKKYKNVTALDRVSLRLKRGRIYGFVGNNGAGKTTLMRIIMGLSLPTSGEIALFGGTGRRKLEKARRRIGALIEDPVVHEGLNALQNLKYESSFTGTRDRREPAALLDRLGIGPGQVGNRAVRGFSMGMRQRCGIAAALLGDPEFLVLDEPTSGVDPEGVRELRALFRELNEQGKTLLISSHILGELFRTATDFIVIDRGHILRELTHEEAEAEQGAFESVDDYFLDLIGQRK